MDVHIQLIAGIILSLTLCIGFTYISISDDKQKAK